MVRGGPKSPKIPNELRLLSQADSEPLPAPPSAGTDLAKFAEDVITLNRQAGLSPASMTSNMQVCRISSLESLQGGLKVKKSEDPPSQGAQVTEFKRLRKE